MGEITEQECWNEFWGAMAHAYAEYLRRAARITTKPVSSKVEIGGL